MRLIIKRRYVLSRVDYKFIKQQLKEKKIKMKHIREALGIKKDYLWAMLNGVRYVSIDLMNYLEIHEIKTFYEPEVIE